MADTERRPVTLAVATWKFLDQLSKQGTHGTSVPDVAKTLIEEGIRQAIKDGFLTRSAELTSQRGTRRAETLGDQVFLLLFDSPRRREATGANSASGSMGG